MNPFYFLSPLVDALRLSTLREMAVLMQGAHKDIDGRSVSIKRQNAGRISATHLPITLMDALLLSTLQDSARYPILFPDINLLTVKMATTTYPLHIQFFISCLRWWMRCAYPPYIRTAISCRVLIKI